ncbi:peptidoglycan DD-metalloendopeptidase family protein [Virgibacillus indicus]|uniref:peptidoglycan DD-metalloendopeptidase family protein n=1 Tax=Virgibacillus indicus TaxID=2024554 RepID=UPI001F0A81B1|nr:M23 family metallopeptidase [Virgibacillus indicus]
MSEGDEVSAGDVLGLAGNSGNSSEPHIHFHVADGPDWKEASSIRIKLEHGAEPVRGDAVTGF